VNSQCTQFCKRCWTTRKQWLWIAEGLFLLLLCLWRVVAAHAQQGNRIAVNNSDLAQQNHGRVGASATEIKAILGGNGGLMVALKHWVAKDATDHGQIVSDSDLTDDAIFARLEADPQFRSVATSLLQRYGYLIPKVNPDSDLGKERELLVQERAKWIAQEQEATVTQTRQRESQSAQGVAPCVPIDNDCDVSSSLASSPGNSWRSSQPEEFPSTPASPQPSSPNVPGAGGSSLLRAQGGQFADDSNGVSPQSRLSGSYGSTELFNGLNVSGLDSPELHSVRMSAGASPETGAARGNSSVVSSGDGLLAAFGSGMSSANGTLPQSSGIADSGSNIPMAGRDGSPAQSLEASTPRPARPALAQPPELIRQQSPYDDIPSLYDMYLQAVPRPAEPGRFGAEVFESGTRDSQLIPIDLPVGPDYVVGPGDGLSVDLWGGVSQRLYRVVDREGRVSLPEVGPVLVSGKSLAEVQGSLQQILRTQFRDISADVSLARLRTIRVYEVGDLKNPGAYDISSLSTPLNALFAAGGPTERGSMRIVKHYRGTQLVQTVDLYDLLLHGVKTNLQRLENGDTIQVPPIGPQITVDGMVRRPGIYELRDEKSLASALELAGGLLPTAALRHIEVQRIVDHEKQTMLTVDVPEADTPAEVTKKLESFEIHDGDRIRIFPIVPYNQDAIYLDGHVVRPGRYSFRSDMRVTDVISSYKDLLPEPATRYAEIIRLNAPDFHPSVEGFDLGDALANPAKAPVLHAMDTLRIFSRFDFENPPAVSVLGDVRVPGTYQTAGQIRLADAVHLAGGLSPDAQLADAQVFRYLPDGKFKIFSVSLSQALSGDPVENVLLQPRDRLLIHRNPDAVEPATVYLQGDVARPGRYPLTTEMRVRDLIRVGGGLKPSADTETADLTKYRYANGTKLTGQREAIALPAALAGESNANAILKNGDVLTIRQLAGWDDLGASIVLKGEVKHPGTYGIRPGERLSSILERAGGFQDDAYPYGAVLQRVQVREMELKTRNEIMLRVKDAQNNLELLPDTEPRQRETKVLAVQQWQSTLNQLNSNPPIGRVTIRVSSRIDRWKNSSADIEVRAGDILTVPKRPSYVMVTGQVFNPTAVAYRPGKGAKWYLGQSGGPTQVANKKAIFVIRADGSVFGVKNSLLSGESLSATLMPGDTVVVPEKALGGGLQWQSVLLTAEAASAIASTVFIALRY
jgi:polysaccharide biosynthesis/export protein